MATCLKAPFLMQTSISLLRKREQGMIFKQLNEKLEVFGVVFFFLTYLKRKSKSCPSAWPSSKPMLYSTSASDELSMPRAHFPGRCIRLFPSLKQTKGYIFISYSVSESEADSMNSHKFHRLTSLDLGRRYLSVQMCAGF